MDPKPKKILILYASAGHGHEKAARAVCEALIEKGVETTLLDTLTLLPRFFGKNYRDSYLAMIQHAPTLWGCFYFFLDIPLVYWFARPLRRLVNGLVGAKLEKYILCESPDAVVSTHFMATEIVGHLKTAGKLKTTHVTVVTDYIAHEIWLDRGVDCYAGGSEDTLVDLRARGIPEADITVTGIPIEKKFSKTLSKDACRISLGIPINVFTALITSGGAGIGSMQMLVEEVVRQTPSAQVLAVCGTNEGLFSRLKTLSEKYPQVHPFGFVNNIQDLMTASDVVIGKGGGLTVSESLAIGRPLILYGSVPGQETRNAACMEKRGAARLARSIPQVGRFAAEFADSEAQLKKVTLAAAGLGRPHAAETIAKLVLSYAG